MVSDNGGTYTRSPRRISLRPCFLALSLWLAVLPDFGESRTDGKDNGQGQKLQDESAVYSEELTPLQKHAAFFDRDKDGLIYASETYEGMRAIGAGVALSVFAAAFINGALGPETKPGKIPSLRLPIYVTNIKKGKHGSDTGAYDSEGRFVPEKFEAIFKEHAKTNPHALTSMELEEMLKGNRVPNDYAGWTGALVEWKILYLLGKDKDGLLQKEVVRGVYDGTLFLQLEERNMSKKIKT